MLKIIEKLGSNTKIVDILNKNGWDGTYSKFAMQKLRNRLTIDVAVILWDYCNKNKIPVKPQDFYEAQ